MSKHFFLFFIGCKENGSTKKDNPEAIKIESGKYFLEESEDAILKLDEIKAGNNSEIRFGYYYTFYV